MYPRNVRLSLAYATLGGALLFGALTTAVAGGLSAFSIPVAPFGDAGSGSGATPVMLTPQTFLVAVEGPDGDFETDDDTTLLVKNVGGTTTTVPLATPFLSSFTGRTLRLSATRALVLTAGEDGAFSTADDGLYLLDELGSGNTVTPIILGGLNDQDGYTPTMLSAASVVVATRGEDLAANTADDVIKLLTDLGGTNTITDLPAERLAGGRGRPTALTPTSFLVTANGPDAAVRTADDEVYLFTEVGTSNTRTDINVPRQFGLAPRQPVRLSATSAILTTAGPDGIETNADDQLALLSGLGTTNTVTPIPVPHIQDFGSGAAVPLSATTVLVATEGPDSNKETADDVIAVVTGLGTTNMVTPVTVGGLDEDRSSKPVRLSPDRVAVSTGGANGTVNSADDEVVVISDVGTANTVDRVPVGGLSFSAASYVLALSATDFAVSNGGADGSLETGLDDAVTLVRLGGALVSIESVLALGNLDGTLASSVQDLGRGRAVVVASGANGEIGTGGDDVFRVITGLPDVRRIVVTKLQLKTGNTESFSVKGSYGTDDASLLAGSDVTVSVGNAAQTIPAARFRLKTGGVLEYKDSKRLLGFVTKLVLDPRKGKFQVAGKGVDLGVGDVNPDFVPVSVAAGDVYLADVVDPRPMRNGLKFP